MVICRPNQNENLHIYSYYLFYGRLTLFLISIVMFFFVCSQVFLSLFVLLVVNIIVNIIMNNVVFILIKNVKNHIKFIIIKRIFSWN